MNTTTYKNPRWWNREYDSAWERTKEAFKRDWDQTRHDVGGDEPDTNQSAKDTIKQAAGKEAIPPRGYATYEDLEPAYRFGFGARSQYGDDYPEWDDELEGQLQQDWKMTDPERAWEDDRIAVRYGWDYDPD